MTERAQERLARFEARPLTDGEMAIARSMFGAADSFARTRIVQLPRARFGAMAPLSGAILFSRWRAPLDFAASPLAEQGWFVHELTHVRQALGGTLMPLAKLGAIGARAYTYRYIPGKPLLRYNIEQQAEIGRHLFLARRGAPAQEAPPANALEALWREAAF